MTTDFMFKSYKWYIDALLNCKLQVVYQHTTEQMVEAG